MKSFSITIQSTNRPEIVKFDTNKFLTQHESFEFHNIEEAARSPLAQELFYLPFVKTVYISQNFVGVEKYNIVSWNDVQEEIANKISDYLNNGGVVIKPSKEENDKKIPISVYAEITPNPKVMKFVANKKLVLEIAEFKNIDEAKQAPLAAALFHFPFVKEVFMDENYISINKYDIAEWEDITQELREFIKNYLEEGKPILNEEAMTQTKTSEPSVPTPEPIVYEGTSKAIVDILEEYIKPAVASDGGNILFKDYNEGQKKVSVVLQGACSGCPSSTITLKNGIETMLKDMLPGKVAQVEAING